MNKNELKERVIKRFLDRVRGYTEEINGVTQNGRPNEQNKPVKSDELFFGLLPIENLNRIIDFYDKNANIKGPGIDIAVADMEGFSGKSLSRYLVSQSGFFNPNASTYLANKLNIHNHYRYTFLGGLNHIKPDEKQTIEILMKEESNRWLRDYVDRCHDCMDRGEIQKAWSFLNKALALSNTDADAIGARGRLYMIQGKCKEAGQDFQNARKSAKLVDKKRVNKNFSELMCMYGWNFYNSCDYEKALRHFNMAVELDPENEGARIQARIAQSNINSYNRPQRRR